MSPETSSLLRSITTTPGCSVVPRTALPARPIPDGCPQDIAEFAEAADMLHLFQQPSPDGKTIRNDANAFCFVPWFREDLSGDVLSSAEEYQDPRLAVFQRCFRLGWFGHGNYLLILDLVQPDRPLLRYMHFFPTYPLDDYKIVPFSFSEVLRRMLELGPNRSFREVYIHPWDPRPRNSDPAP